MDIDRYDLVLNTGMTSDLDTAVESSWSGAYRGQSGESPTSRRP